MRERERENKWYTRWREIERERENKWYTRWREIEREREGAEEEEGEAVLAYVERERGWGDAVCVCARLLSAT